jgi:hypothetical protein
MSDQEPRSPPVENPLPLTYEGDDLIQVDVEPQPRAEQVDNSDDGRRSGRRSVGEAVSGFFRNIRDRLSRSPSPTDEPNDSNPASPLPPPMEPTPARPSVPPQPQQPLQEPQQLPKSNIQPPRQPSTNPNYQPEQPTLKPIPIIKPSAPPQQLYQPLRRADHSDYGTDPEVRRIPPRYEQSLQGNTTTDESDTEGRRVRYYLRRDPSTGQRYQSSRSGRSSADTDYSTQVSDNEEYPKNPKGAAKIVKAFQSANYVALRPKRFTDKEKRRAARKMTADTSVSKIRAAIGEEDERMDMESLQPEYAGKLEKLSSKLKSFKAVDADTYDKIRKAMKRDFPQYFSKGYDRINAFLEQYTQMVNMYKPSQDQAEKLLLSYFNDSDRATIKRQIEFSGLQGAIDYLRKHKTNAHTIQRYENEAKNWRLDRTKEIEPQLVQLHDFHANANPSEDDCFVKGVVMAQLRTHLTDTELKTLQAEMTKKKIRRSGRGMNFDEIIDFLGRHIEVKPKKEKKERDVNSVQTNRNVDTQSGYDQRRIYSMQQYDAGAQQQPPTVNHYVGQGQITGNTFSRPIYAPPALPPQPMPPQGLQANVGQSYYQGSMSNQQPPRIPYDDMVFVKQNHPDFSRIAQNFSKMQLEEKTPQTDDRTYLELSDHSIVPADGVEVKPYPRRLAIFYRNPRNKRAELTRALLAHFEGRCSTCGLPGHRNASKTCPLQSAADSWGICSRCRRGFHLSGDCRYNEVYLAKNEEPSSESQQRA